MTAYLSRGTTQNSQSARLIVEELESRSLLSVGSSFVASGIVNSLEHYEDFVAGEYVRFLRRRPDAGGMITFTQALANGVAPEVVEAIFVSSNEYIFDHAANPSAWITGLYHDLLGRSPDAAGFNAFRNDLAIGISPGRIALFFATSVERDRIVITEDFRDFLGRAATAGEMNFFLNEFGRGVNRAGVAVEFVASNEFFTHSGGTNNDFVLAAYATVLNRTPSLPEVNFWLSFLPFTMPK